MNSCKDNNIGQMLHAFELKQLDAEQSEKFELHLLDCDYCFEQVSRFENIAGLLRFDSDVRELVSSHVDAADAAPARARAERAEPFWSRLRALLWPETNLLLKPVVTYIIVLLLAYPAFVGIRHLSERPVQGVQSLLLTGTRTLADHTAAADRPLVVMFRIAGAREGMTYRVTVKTESGDVVYENDQFADFNDREMATLLLAAGSLEPGRYQIEVFPAGGDSPLHEYTFLVE